MLEFCGGPLWNDTVTWTTDDPDFTPCFQETILVWVPCFFLWVFLALEIYYIYTSRYRNIPWSILNIGKYIIAILLITSACVDLGMAADLRIDYNLYPVHIVTPVIKILTFCLAFILIYFHRAYGIRSSGLLFLFSLFLCVFAVPQFRTEIRRFTSGDENYEHGTWNYYKFISYMIYFSLTCLQLFFNCFADRPPQKRDYPKASNSSPELASSFLRKLFFQWFDPMTWKGYRRPLETNDIWALNPDNISKNLVPEFDKHWNNSVEKGKKAQYVKNKKEGKPTEQKPNAKTNGSILPPMILAFGGPFWFAGLLKLVTDLLSFASPQLLGLLIGFTADFSQPLWKGLLYAFGLFFVAFISTIFQGQYFYKTYLVGFRIRSAIISSIYRKSFKMSSSAKKDSTVGEIVNLMAVDAQRFFELTSYLHMIWSAPLVIGLAIYFLWQYLGPSVLSGLLVMILLIPLNGFIALKLKKFQVKQMNKKDQRVKMMNEILSGIKVLKLYAWEPSFEDNIKETRNEEVDILKEAAYYSAGTYFVWTMAPFLVALASFATFVMVDENNVLDPQTAFVSLALFNILRFPMAMLPMMITLAMQAWVSITRINKFMNNEELDPDTVTHEPSDKSILIENGNFSWEVDADVILKNINLSMNKNALTAIVGPVGCGKSSLISAMLGEMSKISGKVNTYGSIAYIPQQAWIQNASLKDNILFGKTFDENLYEMVIEACALKPDIDMLPGGDQTEIGEKGINLSGGQKQRVSLARAVYSKADIYLLDDPLSAVDSHVGKHIFDKVIGPKGLLAGKSRLLVTHGISFLPQIDEILVFINGEITESGSYKSLLKQKGAFADFLLQHLQELDDEEELSEIKQVLDDKNGKQILHRAMSMRSSGSSKNGSLKEKKASRTSSIVKDIEKPVVSKTRLIEKEESATGSVGIGVYIRYFKSIGIPLTALTLCMNSVNQAFSVYSNVWLTRWSSDPTATQPAVRDMYLGVYGALGVLQAVSMFVASIALAIGCLNAARELHHNLLHHSFRLPMSFFDTTPLGRIMNRFSKDIDMVDNTLPMSFRLWIMMFFSVIAIFLVISVSTPIFMSVIIPIGVLYYFIQNFYVMTSRQLKRIESVTRSPIYSHFGETLTGQSTIRAYGKQDTFSQESEERVDFNQMCSYPSIIANRWLAVRLEIIGALVILFAALFAVLGRESVSPAIVGLSVSYALQITQTLSLLVRMTAEVETNIVAIERIEEYAELPQEAPWQKGTIDPLWPQNGKVEFNNFQLRYRDGLDLVLKGITLNVKGGEKIGIVGRTGAGKSSLTIALFRLIEAAGGNIKIDDIQISELGLHSLRSRLTIIPQDPVLFSGTLRMNIDPFNAYSDDAVWLVLEHSHLKSFVKGLQKGLTHEVNEGGENLSVGQRQLICLARALLRKTKVLILDEATAAVDLETDDLIQKTIRKEFTECTILTIAHRLNTILDSDRVCVLDRGQIVELDKPDILLANKDSIFYGMAKNAGLVSNH